MRVALTIAYNGTHFLGSQIQKESSNTIFGELERVLKMLGLEQRVVASGRTDRGVHATGQVCHIDLKDFWDDTIRLKRVLNEMLPPSIHIRSIKRVTDNFHARYSAKKRVYRYIIKEGESNPFEADFITFVKDLDTDTIQKNIQLFIGEFDFKYFMKTGSQTSTSVREIYRAFAYKKSGYLVLYFEANGFLRSQIRLMVGALLNLDNKQIQEKLLCQTNHPLKPAPANGLYLARILY